MDVAGDRFVGRPIWSVDACPPRPRSSLSSLVHVVQLVVSNYHPDFDDEFLRRYNSSWRGRQPLPAHTTMYNMFMGRLRELVPPLLVMFSVGVGAIACATFRLVSR